MFHGSQFVLDEVAKFVNLSELSVEVGFLSPVSVEVFENHREDGDAEG